ncbi:MAG: hypothetical protein D6698_08960, partial [Gammaproteobacteria bacterium]
MKEIINELYELIQNPPEIPDEWCEKLGHDIATMLKHRMQENKPRTTVGLSAIGKGDRYLWYTTKEDIIREPLHPAARFKFLFGDIIELVYIALIRLAGHEVTDEQKEVELNGFKGHIDCLVDGRLVDIKSASSYSFKKFEEGTLHLDDKFGYYAQLAAYSQALGVDPAGWFVWDKQLGHMTFCEARPEYLHDMYERTLHVKKVLEQKEPPERCHKPVPDGKSGNMKLCTECSYCPFKFECWKDANDGYGIRTFIYSTGPRYLVEVAKQPNVP